MGITWGYIRVSTDDQGAGLAAQREAVLAAGVDERHICVDDGVSGTTLERPALTALLAEVRQGDVIVFHKMDRLGRSVRGVLNMIESMKHLKVELRFLNENIDTTTPHGKFFFVVMLALAEMERDMISQRTKSALAEIKRTGIGKSGAPVQIGRRKSLTEQQEAEVVAAVEAGAMPAKLARQYNVSRATIYNVVGKHQKCIETVSVV